MFFSRSYRTEIRKGDDVEATKDFEVYALHDRVEAAGLFERSDGFYICQAAMILTLCAVSLWLVVTGESFLLGVLASATIRAFTEGHGGYLMHDTAHGSVLNPKWHTRWHLLVYDVISFVLGMSLEGWQRKHNDHHKDPNNPDKDPDFISIFLAFSPEQAMAKRGIFRFITRYQHWLFPFLLLFLGIQIRIVAGTYAWKEGTTRARINLLLIALHVALYLWILFFSRGFWEALAFIAVHYGLLGLYLGVAFSINHIGMPILTPGKSLGFLREQVTTARNVTGGPWTLPLITWILGGLNFQSTHHLFSGMPRPHLQKAAVIVKNFCEERAERVEYHEVSFWKALKEVYVYIRDMAQHAA